MSVPHSKTRDLIVVAEDSPPNRMILSHLLEKLDFSVRAFENGAEAWKALNSDCSHAVAVISDLMMPQMDGLQLLQQVRDSANFKEIPFVLLSAISEKEYVDQARSLEANGYILKPVTYERLSKKLQQLFPEKNFPKLVG